MKLPRSLSGSFLAVLALLLVATGLTGCATRVNATNWTSLLVRDGVVYAADLEQVRAFDAETGAIVWTFPSEPDLRQYGPFYTVAMSMDESVLFVTSYERQGSGLFAQSHGVLRALSTEDGRYLWEFTSPGGEFVSAGAASDGVYVVGNSDGSVYAFEALEGVAVWDAPFATDGRVWADPLIISDTVYIASLDHRLYAVDLETGLEQWSEPFEADGAFAGRPLVLEDRLYVGAFDQILYALDRLTGEEQWRFQGEDWFWGTPVTDGTTLYVVDVSGNVYALDLESGDPVWAGAVALAEPVRLAPMLIRDGTTLLVAGDSGMIHVLDAETGAELPGRVGEGQLASLAIEESVLYVSRINANERIQAFDLDRLAAEDGQLWVYPEPEAEE